MISKNRVPHIGPLDAPLFFLGEAPGADEDFNGEPFVGRSGELLNHFLRLNGIEREEIRIGNVCNYRPDKNLFSLLHGTPQLDEGLRELNSYLQSSKPRVIVAMGNEALRALQGHAEISNWRGSVLVPHALPQSFLIPTYHPAAALRDGTMAPQIAFDIKKAKRILEDGYKNPVHNFIIDPTEYEFNRLLGEIEEAPFTCADIETVRGSNHILCIGFSISNTKAFCLKNHIGFGNGCEAGFLARIERVLRIAKDVAFHNGGFDTEVLSTHGVVLGSKFRYDTMLAQRVIEPELPIGLAFCASIYTDEPFYKGDGKETGKRIPDSLWVYNCKDCIVTHQTRLAQEEIFASDPILSKDRDFIFSRINIATELQHNGMLVDTDRRTNILRAVERDLISSLDKCRFASGFDLNFRSPVQVKSLLYDKDKLKLPHRTNHQTGELTSNEDAIVSLLQYVQGQIDDKKTEKSKSEWVLKRETLLALLSIRGLEKMKSSYLEYKISSDGRVRSSYYPAGTDTGRMSCGKYPDGTGINAQTFPRESVIIDG